MNILFAAFVQTPPCLILCGTRVSLFPPGFLEAKATMMWSFQLSLPTFPLALPGRTAVRLRNLRKISICSGVMKTRLWKTMKGSSS